ncbi:phosphatase PAP2 family protein [Limnovirga soli]|uniref:Phosphatase PAP2 family protein n=1 Tax=Limnovirga soli TaxID=2656915 RepID=A0A8J8JXG3_9BACT|nr:phosphatase PAP2 family protein [Limnovirga soli]NNV56316.1 phosphatase PAP2 family protein [Limnovirga soli]
MMYDLNIKNFRAGAIIAGIAAIILIAFNFIIGKEQFFLLLNNNLGSFADYFFAAYTYLGDSILWPIVLAIVIFVLKRKDVIALLISCFIVITLLTQVCKYIIVPNAPRPIKAIADISLIHTVPGVEMHTISSFPSGHTATAFSFYLLFCVLLKKNWWVTVGFLAALGVGYSRIYLAQHFPIDVGAGIITGIISVAAAIQFQRYWWKRKVKV